MGGRVSLLIGLLLAGAARARRGRRRRALSKLKLSALGWRSVPAAPARRFCAERWPSSTRWHCARAGA